MMDSRTTELRYRAFLSYSHADERVARRLHRKLESYRLPKSVKGHTEQRLKPIFRDRDELASSPQLGAGIEKALDQSESLIVVCSPAAVASRWVGEEVRYFREYHPDRPVFAFVAAGDPAADPRSDPAQAAFPVSLVLADLSQPDGQLIEPAAAHASKEADGFQGAFLKLAAGLLNVPFDALRRRELRRSQRRWTALGATAVGLSAVFAVLALQATAARDEAREAQARAELELASERQTREFLVSVFEAADPENAQGEPITVRDALDQAVDRIDDMEFSRPLVRSRYLSTLGQAYASLGLNRRSMEMLQDSLTALPADDQSLETREQRIETRIDLAEVLTDMGENDEALSVLDALENPASGTDPGFTSAAQRARYLNTRGDVFTYLERMSRHARPTRMPWRSLTPGNSGRWNKEVLAESASPAGAPGVLRWRQRDRGSPV